MLLQIKDFSTKLHDTYLDELLYKSKMISKKKKIIEVDLLVTLSLTRNQVCLSELRGNIRGCSCSKWGGLATYTDIVWSGSITASQSNGINIEWSLAGTSEMTANANPYHVNACWSRMIWSSFWINGMNNTACCWSCMSWQSRMISQDVCMNDRKYVMIWITQKEQWKVC